MARQKLKKFQQNKERWNVIEPSKPEYEQVKGKWNELIFKNDRELVVELACGRGEYSLELGTMFPEKNFIGVDIKGDRLWWGSGHALDRGLKNVAYLRTQIQNLHDFFDEGEISELWIVFPDPRPKESDARRRLTHPRFLAMYKNLLKHDGWVRLKTDNTKLFHYTLDILYESWSKELVHTSNLYDSDLIAEHHGITTRYEKMFTEKGFKVNYLKFKFDD